VICDASIQRRVTWPMAVLLALGAWGALASDKQPQEYLDERTAATITVVGAPLIFAYPRTDLAANARDYVTLAATAVNRSGTISYVLIGYFWSTVDPRLRQDALPAAPPLVLQADDRRIELTLRGQSAREAGIGEPVHAPPGAAVTPNVFATDLAALRFVSEARRLTVLVDSGGTLLRYELWEDHRAALRMFVHHMSGAD
jgi:hypothetical protein